MRKEVACILIALILLIPISFGGDTLTVQADVLAASVSISVPGFLDFGTITKGYSSPDFNITINNTGEIDITVTPMLSNSSEKIFNYTYFKRIQSDSWRKIGSFSVNISKPATMGDVRSQLIYLNLDLTNYPDSIPTDIINHESQIVFYAMEKT